MRVSTFLSAATLALATPIVTHQGLTVSLGDGTVYFVAPPRLMGATATFNATNAWGATYYFTLSLPENADEPLQRVTIKQQEGGDDIRYDLEATRAFIGTRRDRKERINLGAVTQNQETQTISVTFDPPVPPGNTVTLALYPKQNPTVSGVYLLGVTAFPPGEKVHGQFLGFGRLHFYRHRGTFLFK
jgi:Protein of unknown function (DUF2808)